MEETFRAGTQYGDWKGTAAADNHDRRDLRIYLEEKGLLKENERIVGITMFSGEVHTATQDEEVYVTVLVSEGQDITSISERVMAGEILQVRKISFQMYLNEFFCLFKRFELCISNHGMIDGRDYEASEE